MAKAQKLRHGRGWDADCFSSERKFAVFGELQSSHQHLYAQLRLARTARTNLKQQNTGNRVFRIWKEFVHTEDIRTVETVVNTLNLKKNRF